MIKLTQLLEDAKFDNFFDKVFLAGQARGYDVESVGDHFEVDNKDGVWLATISSTGQIIDRDSRACIGADWDRVQKLGLVIKELSKHNIKEASETSKRIWCPKCAERKIFPASSSDTPSCPDCGTKLFYQKKKTPFQAAKKTNEATVLGKDMTKAAKEADTEQSDREWIKQQQKKAKEQKPSAEKHLISFNDKELPLPDEKYGNNFGSNLKEAHKPGDVWQLNPSTKTAFKDRKSKSQRWIAKGPTGKIAHFSDESAARRYAAGKPINKI